MVRTPVIAGLVVILMVTVLPAAAALHDRGGGLVYDDVLNVTWLQDAALGNTQVGPNIDWQTAMNWAQNLVYAGYSDWRAPNMDINDDGTFVDCKLSSITELECRDNEMSYMYVYNGITNATPGIFTGLGILYYWSSTESPFFPGLAVLFKFSNGVGGTTSKATTNRLAWAVRDGDSIAPAADGDLAPLGAPDGLVNTGDLLIAIRIAMGILPATPLELVHGDVYPPGSPDGVINIQDVLLMSQIVFQ